MQSTGNFEKINTRYLEVNKTKVIYLAYDCELMPALISESLQEIKKYCKANYCNYSTYPVGTFCLQ